MTERHDGLDRDALARLRFAIIGPLLAAPPPQGELQGALRELARRTWQHPTTGAPIRFGASTIERWLYAARRAHADPVAALRDRPRPAIGHARLLLALGLFHRPRLTVIREVWRAPSRIASPGGRVWDGGGMRTRGSEQVELLCGRRGCAAFPQVQA
jgi:hypothetical protein